MLWGPSLIMMLAVGETWTLEHQSVELTVLYRPECVNCRRFIVDQLVPTWRRFSQHMHLDLVLYVPEFYDKNVAEEAIAWTPRGQIRLVHMCALYQTCRDRGTLDCEGLDLARYLDYSRCDLISDPLDNSDRCAVEAGLDPHWTSCQDSEVALRLISYHSGRTNDLHDHFKDELRTLPFILVNGTFNNEEYHRAQHNLTAVVCDHLPDQCMASVYQSDRILLSQQ